VRRTQTRCRARRLTSVVGDVVVERLLYEAESCDYRAPLDATLNLPRESYSGYQPPPRVICYSKPRNCSKVLGNARWSIGLSVVFANGGRDRHRRPNGHENSSRASFDSRHAEPAVGGPALRVTNYTRGAGTRICHGWVVGCTDPHTMFVGSTRDETLVVPATAAAVVAVAGMETKGRFWPQPSRGPAASYRAGVLGHQTPHVAHGAAAGADRGSSFASARVCAETASRLLNSTVRGQCTDRDALVAALLKVPALGTWSRRTGYGSVL